MNKALLINMLYLAYNNQLSKNVLNLAIQINTDTSLSNDLSISDFSNEHYSVRDIRYIKQCFNFRIQ